MYSRNRRSQRAVIIPEVAISVAVFLTTLLTLLDSLTMAFRYASLQYVVSSSLREIAVIDDTMSNEKDKVINNAKKFGLNLNTTQIYLHAAADPSTLPDACISDSESNGVGQDFVSLCISYPTSFLYGLVNIKLTAIAYAKNENYDA